MKQFIRLCDEELVDVALLESITIEFESGYTYQVIAKVTDRARLLLLAGRNRACVEFLNDLESKIERLNPPFKYEKVLPVVLELAKIFAPKSNDEEAAS